MKGTSRTCNSASTGPSQISAEIVLMFAQEKVKLSGCNPIRHMGVKIQFQLFLNSTLHEGDWSVSYSDCFTPNIHCIGGWEVGGSQSWSGHCRKEKNFLTLPRLEPRNVHPTAQSLY